MINCNTDDEKDVGEFFIDYYDRQDGYLKFYTDNGLCFSLEDTIENEKKLEEVLEIQAVLNTKCSNSRFKELCLGVFSFPFFITTLFDSVPGVFDDAKLFSCFYAVTSVSAILLDLYVLFSRSKMMSEAFKDKYFIENVDYINKYIDSDLLKKEIENIDVFLKRDGKIRLSMNDVNFLRLIDLVTLKEVVSRIEEEQKVRKR